MMVDRDLDIRRREAATWFTRLSRRRVSTEDVKAFSAWRRNPDNAQAYERLETVWTASHALAEDPDISALTAEALGKVPPPVRARAMMSRLLKPLGAVAVALIAAASVGVWALNRPLQYATTVGEQRVIRLADGSSLTLGTDTEVQVRLRPKARSVRLVKGQAYFQVQGDPHRPFIVSAGDTRVMAVGTRFDVRRFGDGARVVLVEGRVDVRDAGSPGDDWILRPGQQVLTTAHRPVVTTVDTTTATSWTTGRLIFEQTPIRAAIAEVNRYSERQIVLQAPQIADTLVSGAFDTGDIDGFVAALGDLYPVTAERRPDGTVLISGPNS